MDVPGRIQGRRRSGESIHEQRQYETVPGRTGLQRRLRGSESCASERIHSEDHTVVAEEHRQEITRGTNNHRSESRWCHNDRWWQARGLHEPDGQSTQRDSKESFNKVPRSYTLRIQLT